MNKLTPEQKLDKFIDALNAERRPDNSDNPYSDELQSIARLVKGLRPDSGPRPEFVKRLYNNLAGLTDPQSGNSPIKHNKNKSSRRTFIPWAVLVASILVVAFVVIPWPFKDRM
jgi:hypothetical protein